MAPVIFATVSPAINQPQPASSAVLHPSESQLFGLVFFLLALWLLPTRPQRRRS